MSYSRITDRIADDLEAIVGKGFVTRDPEKLESCSRDETTTLMADERYMPEIIAAPANAAQAAEIMKLANREHIPVTPRAGGTGLSGGALPLFGGIVLTDERMNKIIDIDEANMTAVVEPGVITNDINLAAAEKGLAYYGYPMSVLSCHIGGNIAENAGGGNAVKYGVTMRYVLGLEVVTPTGQILELGGKIMKDVSGYSLKELFVSSEGTLGYVTKIILRLQPMLQHRATLLALFDSTEAAIKAVPVMLRSCGATPSSVEYIDRYCFAKACDYLNDRLSEKDAEASLIVELDGSSEDALDGELEAAGRALAERRAFEVYVAESRSSRERIWAVRRSIDEALRVTDPIQADEDIVVPISEIAAFTKGLGEISARYGTVIATFGHAGDGNLHPTTLKPAEMSLEEWSRTLRAVETDMFELAYSLGGVISGEHGIGSKRREFFKHLCPPQNLEVMRQLKRALDPNGIMNPGKIFDL